MREILFRGKVCYPRPEMYITDEWIYGGYDPYQMKIHFIDEYGQSGSNYVVHVGQYTGLADKNGNKIFEGDIVKAVRSDRERIFHVEYVGTAFYAPEFHWELIDVDFDYQLEVIGNIHDNPELTEGEKHD